MSTSCDMFSTSFGMIGRYLSVYASHLFSLTARFRTGRYQNICRSLVRDRKIFQFEIFKLSILPFLVRTMICDNLSHW